MRLIGSAMLASKFRGSLLGALCGDCCGAPYEGENICDGGERLILKKYFDKLEGPYFTGKFTLIFQSDKCKISINICFPIRTLSESI